MQVLHAVDDSRLPELLESGHFFWLKLEGCSDEQIAELGRRFGLHPLAVEDTQEFGQRPKIDDYGQTALLVFYGVDPDGSPVEVHFHVSGQWMITVHQAGHQLLQNAADRIERETPKTEEEAIYRVLDALTDSFFPVLDQVDDEIDLLMDAMLEKPSQDQRQDLFALRRRLIELRRIATPQRDILARGGDVLGRLPGLEADDARDWFRDVYDHLVRISELIDSYRDLLAGALDLYLSTVSNRLNSISKQLTVVATIFLPLTFVTGFFGQNFGMLVRHINSAAAFWGYGVGGLVVSAGLLLLYFRRQGFLRDD
ncbi:MAG TPA: magnesium transporter CorA family protein [Baekduia sp.]|uniref:magnesium transporter CorA family protein n=1 Tax=Baekduia sp. TaxID=2600305 RepID=UPI002C9B56AC|nr:magnesium transporter CorA family protein [Baekduia sp.]HMJ34723.1 magnesium transporter CorA family protein [Baekduia sp.]